MNDSKRHIRIWLAAVTAACAVTALPASPALAATTGLNVAAIAVDPVTQTVWAAVQLSGVTDAVEALDEHADTVTATFSVPADVTSIAVDPKRGTTWPGMVWAGSSDAPGTGQILTGIDEATQAVTTVDLSRASSGSQITGIAADSGNHTVFVLMTNGTLVAIPEANPASFAVITSGAGVAASAVAVGAGKVWVADQARDTVSAFTEQGAPVAGMTSIGVGRNPVALAADPVSKTLWVVNEAANSVTEISETSGSVLAKAISVGQNPVGIAADPAHHILWVINITPGPGIAEITDSTTPGRLVAIGPGDEINTGGLAILTGVAADPVNGRVLASGNQVLENATAIGYVVSLPPAAPSGILTSTWFSRNNASVDHFALLGSAFPPMVYSMTGAPSWLRLNRLTGVLYGLPPKTGGVAVYHIAITGTNSLGAAHVPFTLNVGSDPAITSAAAVTFVAQVGNRYQMTASGAPAPTFTLEGTGLPAGLSFSASGLLSGTPAAGTEGRYIEGLVAANAVSPNGVGEVFTLDVVSGRAPAFASPSRVTFRHGRPASFTIRASGLPVPHLRLTGTLPPGLRVTMGKNGTALIHGTPTLPRRTYRITITASNGIGRASQILSIVIS